MPCGVKLLASGFEFAPGHPAEPGELCSPGSGETLFLLIPGHAFLSEAYNLTTTPLN
jgi:hypothetical protein